MSRACTPRDAVILLVMAGVVVVAGVATVGSPAHERQGSSMKSDAEDRFHNPPLVRAATAGPAPTDEPAWSMARANAANTNYLNTTGPTTPITVRWRFASEADDFSGGPIVANDTVYFVTEYYGQEEGKGRLYAVDAWTGETRWTFPRPSSFGNRLAVLRNTIYVGTHNGKVYALDTATGDRFWTFTTDGRPMGLTVKNRTLYVTSRGTAPGASVPDGHVYALGALRGEEKWQFTSYGNPAGPIGGPPAVVNGTVYVDERYGRVFALDSQTGTERWKSKFDRSSNIVAANGLVYVVEKSNQTIYALDAETGDRQWSYQAAGKVQGVPALVGNTAYMVVKGDGLYALNARTGTERWHDGQYNRNLAAVVNGTAYVRHDKSVYALDPTTGDEIGHFTPPPFNNSWDRFRSGWVVLNGSLYAGVGIDEPNNRYRSDHTIFYALGTPDFNYTNLSVTPSVPEINETVNVTATVRNTGTGPGTFNAKLVVNDNVTNSTTARLEPRTNTTIRFPLVFQTNASYTVGIHNLSGTITVGEVAPTLTPTNRVETASSTRIETPSPPITPTHRNETSTATPTVAPTPGFGVTVWLLSFILVAELVRLHKRY